MCLPIFGENYLENPGLHRTLIGDGLATSLSALFGGPANTTYGENTGVLELSHVYDPKVIRLAAIYAVILSFIPKMSAVIGLPPFQLCKFNITTVLVMAPIALATMMEHIGDMSAISVLVFISCSVSSLEIFCS